MKKVSMTLLFLSIVIYAAVFMPRSYGAGYEYRMNIGILTKHYINDKSSYNEDSHLYQFIITKNKNLVTAGIFQNSYNRRSHFIGYGREFSPDDIDKLTFGFYVAAIDGYDQHRPTHYGGLLLLPIQFTRYKKLVVTVMVSAVNFGYEIPFELNRWRL